MDSSAAGRRGARGDGSLQADLRDPRQQGGPPVVLCDVAAGFREGWQLLAKPAATSHDNGRSNCQRGEWGGAFKGHAF